jgi:hypothetical protein
MLTGPRGGGGGGGGGGKEEVYMTSNVRFNFQITIEKNVRIC